MLYSFSFFLFYVLKTLPFPFNVQTRKRGMFFCFSFFSVGNFKRKAGSSQKEIKAFFNTHVVKLIYEILLRLIKRKRTWFLCVGYHNSSRRKCSRGAGFAKKLRI